MAYSTPKNSIWRMNLAIELDSPKLFYQAWDHTRFTNWEKASIEENEENEHLIEKGKKKFN